MTELTLPLDLRLSFQKHYLKKVLETLPDYTIEELTMDMSEILVREIDSYDEWDSCADLEPEDHLHFKRKINIASFFNHLFTGESIYFSSPGDRRQFSKDVLGLFSDNASK